MIKFHTGKSGASFYGATQKWRCYFYIIWYSIEHIPNQLPALQVQPTEDYPKLDGRTGTR
ncbi:hypothetical protein CN958_06300 [Bacillus cereus]|uniref:Uncharacterized protein n=1 Tax=Bacillus cereus TaxID=1396 RepID=A0A2B9E7I4_BACCE|nr:hypothetical protein CN958_06300 [Bacillus cereus]